MKASVDEVEVMVWCAWSLLIHVTVLLMPMITTAVSGAKPGEDVFFEAPGTMLIKGPTTTDVKVAVEVTVVVWFCVVV